MLKPFYFCIRISVNKIRIYPDIRFGILSSWVDGDYNSKTPAAPAFSAIMLHACTLVSRPTSYMRVNSRWQVNVVSDEKHWLFWVQSKTTASDLRVCVRLRPDTVISVIWHQCLAVTQRRGKRGQLSGRDDTYRCEADRVTDQHLTGRRLGGGCWRITTCPCGHSLLT